MKTLAFVCLPILGIFPAGCSLFHGPPKITAAGVTVQAPQDAGKPATLDSGTSVASLPIPAGSSLTVTKSDPVVASPATPDTPAQAAQPAKEVLEVKLAGPTEYRKTANTVKASTGTVDTTIAAHKIDAAEARPLLYAALASMLAAGFFIWRAYPTPAMICGGAAVVFLIAWKVADAPVWLWVVAAVGLGGAAFLYLGHERGEKAVVPSPTPPPTPIAK